MQKLAPIHHSEFFIALKPGGSVRILMTKCALQES